jgi:hypothetical protein
VRVDEEDGNGNNDDDDDDDEEEDEGGESVTRNRGVHVSHDDEDPRVELRVSSE